jgi:CBS-domain-containing membrane protein
MATRISVLDRLKRNQKSLGAGFYAALLSLVVLALSGTVGLLVHLPWLFPSLGPTVMLFFESPEQPASRPTNTIVGHGTGLIAGALCLSAFGLQNRPSAPVGGLTAMHVLAGALSVALTTLVLTTLRMPHPPAGATTLIVSLGVLTTPVQLLSMAEAVLLVTAAAWGLNILLGTRPAAKTPA